MKGDIRKKLLAKEMTRKEFLQFAGGSLVVLFGFSNLLSLLGHFAKSAEPAKKDIPTDARHGFGSRKFGG